MIVIAVIMGAGFLWFTGTSEATLSYFGLPPLGKQHFSQESVLKAIGFSSPIEHLNVTFPLPSPSQHFVGRKKLIDQITSHLRDPHISIIGLFGPPAFGKSSLAIHIGHRVSTTQGVTVNYIDLFEFKLSFQQHQVHSSFFHQFSNRELQSYLVEGYTENSTAKVRTLNFNLLLSWAKSLSGKSILVMDNCDQVLHNWHDEFQDFVWDMQKVSKPKSDLKIIITSQRKISFVSNFAAFEVSELSKMDSKLLISKIQPSLLSESIQIELTEVVGNCPLAIKVVVMLLRLTSPIKLIKDLKSHDIDVLSSRHFPKRERFTIVMDTACQHLANETREAAYLFSLFPGSFGDEVISFEGFQNLSREFSELLEHSLLEKYYHHHQGRYKLHKLIRNYFQKNLVKSFHVCTTQNIELYFETYFQEYYFDLFFNFLNSLENLDFSQDDQWFIASEQHNLKHLVSLSMKSDPTTYTRLNINPNGIVVLLFAFNQGLFIDRDNYSTKLLNIILNVLASEQQFDVVCPLQSSTLCSALFTDFIISTSTNTVTGHLSCVIWEKTDDLSKFTKIDSDKTLHDFVENSFVLCFLEFDTAMLLRFFLFAFTLFTFHSWFKYFKIILKKVDDVSLIKYEHTLLFYFGLLSFLWLTFRYSVTLYATLSLSIVIYISTVVFRGCVGNVFLLYWCVLYYWCFALDTLLYKAIPFFTIEGSGSNLFESWCHMCVLFRPVNSFGLFHHANSIVCSIVCPVLPALIVLIIIQMSLSSVLERFYCYIVLN